MHNYIDSDSYINNQSLNSHIEWIREETSFQEPEKIQVDESHSPQNISPYDLFKVNNEKVARKEKSIQQKKISCSLTEREAQEAFQYFLNEVELDDTLTHEEQHDKVQEFKIFADNLSPKVASRLIDLLIGETRSRIVDMLQNAGLNSLEIDAHLSDFEKAILKAQNMNVEIAREMLFFVAELKIHRQYVYDFGIALGCPKEQLLRHDLCKLDAEQFEGYARYFRGGRQEEDKSRYEDAWGHHQHEEHHHQSYSKEGFSFDNFPEDRLRNNMLETAADLLAACKQRGGVTLIDYLVNIFPKQNPHQRLLPFIEDALKKAHAFYLDSEKNPNSEYKLFQGLPCWNPEVEEVFRKLKEAKPITPISSSIQENNLCINWDSPEGLSRLQRSDAKENFWKLSRFYESQIRTTYCSVATAVMALNSLSIEAPQAAFLGKYRIVTQEEFFSDSVSNVIDQKTVLERGMSLEELAAVLNTFPLNILKFKAQELAYEEIHRSLVSALRNPNQCVLALYQRRELNQEGGGHWSPIAAYDTQSDSFLIMDVARFKYPPIWVEASNLIHSMKTANIHGHSRGFIIAEKRVEQG